MADRQAELLMASEEADRCAAALAVALTRRRNALQALRGGGLSSSRLNRALHRAAVDRAFHHHGVATHCSIEHVGRAACSSFSDQAGAVLGHQREEA